VPDETYTVPNGGQTSTQETDGVTSSIERAGQSDSVVSSLPVDTGRVPSHLSVADTRDIGIDIALIPSAPAAFDAGVGYGEVQFSLGRDRSTPVGLSGAEVSGTVHVFASFDSTSPVLGVSWSLDGELFRDNDLYAPYDLVPDAAPFSGGFAVDDLGLGGHEIVATADTLDGPIVAVSAFTVVERSTETYTVPASSQPPPTVTGPALADTAVLVDAGRPVVSADASTVLDQPDTIYDFGFGSPGNVVILASNVEARNIKGPGKRQIGERNGASITDSGFRNFEFTFANVAMSAGTTFTRPYFINGTDVNPQPNVGDNDLVQIFAYGGDIIDPLLDQMTIYGKQRPPGSVAHNDGLQLTGLNGGRVVNPTVRNSTILGGSNAAIQVGLIYGQLTIEGSTLEERFGGWHAVNATTPTPGVAVLWRNNTLLNGSSAAFLGGWSINPSSNGITDTVTIN